MSKVKKTYVGIGIIAFLVVILMYFTGYFTFVSGISVTAPTNDACLAELNDFIKTVDSTKYTCDKKCFMQNPVKVTSTPQTFGSWQQYSLYDAAAQKQYYWDGKSTTNYNIITSNLQIPSLLGQTGYYRLEYRGSCTPNAESEDMYAKTICAQEQDDGSYFIALDYLTGKKYDGYDVYYRGNLDTFNGYLSKECANNQYCVQKTSTMAVCEDKAAPVIKYFCSNDLVIKDTDGFQEVVDDCRADNKACVTGKSQCDMIVTATSPGTPTQTTQPSQQYTNTGSSQVPQTPGETQPDVTVPETGFFASVKALFVSLWDSIVRFFTL